MMNFFGKLCCTECIQLLAVKKLCYTVSQNNKLEADQFWLRNIHCHSRGKWDKTVTDNETKMYVSQRSKHIKFCVILLWYLITVFIYILLGLIMFVQSPYQLRLCHISLTNVTEFSLIKICHINILLNLVTKFPHTSCNFFVRSVANF